MAEDPSGVPRSQISIRTVLTVCLTVLLIAACVVFVIKASVAVTVSLVAALIAVALHHGVDFLVRHRATRRSAVALTLFGFISAIVAVIMVIVPPALSQGSSLVTQAPKYLSRVQNTWIYKELEPQFHFADSESTRGADTLTATAEPALKAVGGVLRFLAEAASTLFLVVFMLIFGDDIVRAALAETLPARRARYERMAIEIYHSVGGYIAGLGFICLVNATLTTSFLAIVRVPFFLPLGIASGFSSLVPYAGPIVSGGIITLITLAARGPWVALATFVYFLCYGQLEGQILGPLVYKRTVHVSPLVTFMSILFLGDFAGVIGAVVAVPAAAAGQIIVKDFLAHRRERLALK